MKLAIKGHETRGAEVIALLEMLGGINVGNLYGDVTYAHYFINNNYIDVVYVSECNTKQYLLYSLEEFLEKFPYKVGDKVIIKVNNQEAIIDKVVWCCDTIIYWVKYNDCLEGNWRTEHLQTYKEGTMESKFIVDYVKESDDRYRIVLNHQFDMEVDEGEYYAVRRKPQYPKTYGECCELLSLGEGLFTKGYKASLIQDFQKLLICRDSYWRIAGDQMGLGKPWKPDWKDFSTQKYSISIDKDEIITSYRVTGSRVLVFPTEEMRDAFFENFKELIEECKELL